MSLESNSMLGQGGAGFQGDGSGTAAAMIRELQGLTVSVVAGAAANTDIALPGINPEDTIISAVQFAGGVPSGITADASISSEGNVQFSSDTSGNQVLLFWFDKNA